MNTYPICSSLLGQYTTKGDLLQQQVEATYLSVCTGRATSCSNKSRPHISPCVQVARQVTATSRGHISLRVYKSGDKLKQQVEATYHSVCTGRATSCSTKSRRHITPCVQVGRLVAATRCGDISLRVHRSGDYLQQHGDTSQ